MRKTEIKPDAEEFNPEDFYADEEMIITISHLGYIKRTSLSEFKTQNRGGVGAKGSATRDEDFLEHIFNASMHNTMLFFTEMGKCFWLKVYDIPEGARNTKGRAVQNILNLDPEDKIKAFINVRSLSEENRYIILCTKKGVIKKTPLEAYSRPRANGIIAINVREGDNLIEAKLTSGNDDILLAIRSGKAIRFNEQTVRPVGRTASGVKGVTLANEETDEVVGMVCVSDPSVNILVVSEAGYGKRSELDDYRITNRGGKGVKTINLTDKTGELISIRGVNDAEDLMIITKNGLTIRLSVAEMRVMGRNTQGVKLINLRKNDSIAAVTQVPVSEEVEEYNEGDDGQSLDVEEQNDGITDVPVVE